MNKWIQKKVHKIYKGRIFTLNDVECYHPDKKINYNFFMLQTNDWINIVALTEDNKFIMVKQHRLGTDELTIETPGGLIDDNESPNDTAYRELLEETGYKPEKIFLLKKLSTNPAILNNYIHFYYAPGCKKVSEQKLDQAEDIEILTFSRDEILEMIKDGKINHSIVVTAFSLYFMSNYCDHIEKY